MSRKKILVIEDEVDILEVLEYNLLREGYDVVTSRDGADGRRKATAEHPDLILLDIMLPSLDGIERQPPQSIGPSEIHAGSVETGRACRPNGDVAIYLRNALTDRSWARFLSGKSRAKCDSGFRNRPVSDIACPR